MTDKMKIDEDPLKAIDLWYSIRNGGDGSANLAWFLSEEAAEKDHEAQIESWGEFCGGSVQTYEGSDIHLKALVNSGTTTMDLGIGKPVRVVEDAWDHDDAIEISFSGEIPRVYKPYAKDLGWDGKSPIIWSYQNRVCSVYG